MALNLTPELSKSFTYLLEAETVAQEILTLKEAKLDLANTLNKLRESLRALKNTEDRRSFIQVGALFMEYSTEECQKIIQEEIDTVKQQYDSTCIELREKVVKMRDIEYEPQIQGVGLKPLSYKEAQALMKGFGVQ